MKLNSCFEYECVIVFHGKIITALRVCVSHNIEKRKQSVIASGSFNFLKAISFTRFLSSF